MLYLCYIALKPEACIKEFKLKVLTLPIVIIKKF